MNDKSSFTVEILFFGWVNMYAPFFLNVMRYNQQNRIELEIGNSFKIEDSLLYKIADEMFSKYDLTGSVFPGTIKFTRCKTDTEIIETLYSTEQNKNENIFRIGLCEPVFLRQTENEELYQEKKAELTADIFIDRLLLWGLADLSRLYEHRLLKQMPSLAFSLFQTNVSTSIEEIVNNLNGEKANKNNKQLKIYTYAEGTTVHNKVLEIFKDANESLLDYQPMSSVEDVYKPLKDNGKQDPWLIFTAEPAKAFRFIDSNETADSRKIGFIFSPGADKRPFTALICRNADLGNPDFRKFFEEFKENLNKTIEVFYASDLNHLASKSDDKNFELDLLEWQIFQNQRIYTFDIKQEAKKWRDTFEDITKKIQEEAEKDDRPDTYKAENASGYDPDSLLKQGKGNFIDEIAKEILPKIQADGDLKEQAKYLLHTLSALQNETQKASRKSAIAAIISRNMSHNLGSHVINYLKHYVDILGKSLSSGTNFLACGEKEHKFKETDLQDMFKKGNIDEKFLDKIVWRDKDNNNQPTSFLDESLYRFLEYLNRRMEFIATMTTSVPSTPLAMNFESEIWRPLAHKNSFLVDFIAKSDLAKGTELALNWKLDIKNKDRKNLQIAIPDGVVGCHALYTIIENFIRNSAKHGSQGSKIENLNITIRISEHDNDYFEVKISDNLKNGEELIQSLKKIQKEGKEKKLEPFNQFEKIADDSNFHIINPRLIDDTGRLIHQMWGIKEMFIGACFLRGLTPEEYNLEHDNLPVLSVGTDDAKNLVYKFYIMKPKFLLILQQDDCQKFKGFEDEKFKDHGVDLLDYKTFETGKYFIRHRFCLLHECPSKEMGECEVNNGKSRCVDEYDNWIARNENLLPYRIFCDCEHLPRDRSWVKWQKEWSKEKSFDSLKDRLYSEWINRFYDLDELPALIIIDQKAKEKVRQAKEKDGQEKAVLLSSCNELKDYFKENKPKSAVIFRSHLMKDSKGKEWVDIKTDIDKMCSRVAWEDISGGNATDHLIREVNWASDVGLRKYELIEACLASVVIVDERIYNNCDKNFYDFNWDWQNIRVYNFAVEKDEEDKNKKYFISKHCEPEDLDHGYEFLKNGDKKTDFLVIHRGILEKILETEKEDVVDGLFEKLMGVVKFVIVDSGRGKPDYISKSRYVRFVNLENLYQWFFDCKVSLVRGLFSLINREEV